MELDGAAELHTSGMTTRVILDYVEREGGRSAVAALKLEHAIGLLSCLPLLFGMPAARVRRERCAVDGADACIYEVRWRERHSTPRAIGAWGVASVGAAALTARLRPRGLPVAAAVSGAGAATIGGRTWLSLRRRVSGLDAWLREQTEVNDRLTESLRDLVSELRLADVALLDSFAAQAAIAVAHGRTLGRLEARARQDPLTGLLNHRELHEALERELDRSRRYDKRLAVILFDVDRGDELADHSLYAAKPARREAW